VQDDFLTLLGKKHSDFNFTKVERWT
jgi:hypothetical protein